MTFEPALCANLGDLGISWGTPLPSFEFLTAPPLFLCSTCADSAQAELPLRFLRQPLPVLISATCQNKVIIVVVPGYREGVLDQ